MKKIFNNIIYTKKFEKELNKLEKKYRTIKEDLDTFIKIQLKAFHKLNIDNRGIVRISELGIEYPEIYKAKKFACKSLKGKGAKSGIRIIYAYYREEDIIEFIEIYFKGDKEKEDRERIIKRYKKEGK